MAETPSFSAVINDTKNRMKYDVAMLAGMARDDNISLIIRQLRVVESQAAARRAELETPRLGQFVQLTLIEINDTAAPTQNPDNDIQS